MNTQELIKAVRKVQVGYEVRAAIEQYVPDLRIERDKGLENLTASYKSVEPAASQYYAKAVAHKNNIVKTIENLPEDVKDAIKPYIIPTGFYS